MGMKEYLMTRNIYSRVNTRFKLFVSDDSLYTKLLACGMTGLTNPTDDGIGARSGVAVQAETLIGDNTTYIDLEIDVSLGNVHDIEFFVDLTTNNTVLLGNKNNTIESITFTLGNQLRYRDSDNVSYVTPILGHTETKKYKYERNLTDLKLYENDVLIDTHIVGLGTLTINRLLGYQTATFNWKNNLELLKLTWNGKTYQSNFSSRSDDGIVSLYNIEDNTDVINGEQFLSPAISTIVNNTVVDLFDLYGGTIAGFQTHTFDIGGLEFVPEFTLMPAMKNGKLTTFVNGVNPTADSVGRIKYDIVITDNLGVPNGGIFEDGNYFKSADKYNGKIIEDTTNIMFDGNGDPINIEIATVLQNTNNQQFINKATKKIAWTKAPLTGDCLADMIEYMEI